MNDPKPPLALPVLGDRTERQAADVGPGGVGFVSLGCPKNLVDSEIMLGHLQRSGHGLSTPEEASIVVINTCGFIDAAKEESVDAILEQVGRKERGEIERVVVAGCMVQKYGAELRQEIPEIDAFVGLDELERIAPAVGGQLAPEEARQAVKPLATRLYDEASPRVLQTGGAHAYLKIAEGCNNPCTFCTIPQMRGMFRSRTVESLVAEALNLEQTGVQELVLIAQDTTRYGEDIGLGRAGLARLVETLLARTDFRWIRFLYAYPTTLDDSVLRLMGSEERFVSYIDIPLQAVARPVLAAMRRGGDDRGHRRLLENVRDLVPDVALRTTFIVGFPGEGDAEHEQTMAFVRDMEFDHLGVFTYSPEPESGSEPLGDPVPEEIKNRRRDEVMALQQEISRRRNESLVGQVRPALIEGLCAETDLLLEGRLGSQAPGIDSRLLVNDVDPELGLAPPGFAEVEITEAHDYDLVGRVVRLI